MSNKNYNKFASLWMGDIDQSMDERFIKTSFHLLGAKVSNVKVVRDKTSGHPLGYGFVSFDSQDTAQKVLQELNGQQIPNAIEGKRFRLNNTSVRDNEVEHSIYVRDLTAEVDDYTLFAAFAAQYPSTCSAKVMYSNGQSKGYGFVRFSHESDYRLALTQCQNINMVGGNPITVRAAKPKQRKFYLKRNPSIVSQESLPQALTQALPQQSQQQAESQSQDVIPLYTTEANTYYPNYAANAVNTGNAANTYWCYGYMIAPYNSAQYGVQYDPYVYGQQLVAQPYYPYCDNVAYPTLASHTYVDHGQSSQFIDTDKLNDEMIAKNEDLYMSIDNSRWSSSADCDKEMKVQ